MSGQANSDQVPNHPPVRTFSTGRPKADADPSRSSLHMTPKVSGKPSSSTSHPVPVQTQDNDPDATEDEDWKEMGVARLRRAPRLDQTSTSKLPGIII